MSFRRLGFTSIINFAYKICIRGRNSNFFWLTRSSKVKHVMRMSISRQYMVSGWQLSTDNFSTTVHQNVSSVSVIILILIRCACNEYKCNIKLVLKHFITLYDANLRNLVLEDLTETHSNIVIYIPPRILFRYRWTMMKLSSPKQSNQNCTGQNGYTICHSCSWSMWSSQFLNEKLNFDKKWVWLL